VSLNDDYDPEERPTRDLKPLREKPLRLVLVTPRTPAAKHDLDALDQAFTDALDDPPKPTAA